MHVGYAVLYLRHTKPNDTFRRNVMNVPLSNRGRVSLVGSRVSVVHIVALALRKFSWALDSNLLYNMYSY